MKSKIIVTVFLLSLVICSCKRDFGTYYDPPKGQQSSIYEQLAKDSRFTTFVSAIDKVPGLKNELSTSGLFTIMAPDNEAFIKFFGSHPTFKSLDLIPADTLNLLVKYHIMKWMLFQINFLNPGITKDNFKAYKYDTRATLVYTEQTISGRSTAIYYPAKIMQVYTPNFFSLYNVTAQDYTDVYGAGSSIAGISQMNVMGAAVTEQDVSSGNGVIHVIDKVLIPPPTVAQLLELNSEYSAFAQLLKKRFLTYTYNQSATIAQGNNGDINGDGLVDSLWTRNYAFSSYLDDENPKTTDTKAAFTLTAFAPSKAAFSNYLTNTLAAGFSNNVDSIPNRTLTLFYQTYFSQNMYWPSQLYGGNATNILGNKYVISAGDINNIRMASNAIFYELKKVIEPDAFKAVTGPAFLASKYWYFAEMLIKTGILSGLTKEGTRFTILCPTNKAFNNYGIYYDPSPGSLGPPGFFISPPTGTASPLSVKQLIALVGNHIIVNYDLPASGITDGFYPTLNNSIIIVEGGKIHGSVRDTVPQITDPDKHMATDISNGIDKTIRDPQESIYNIINSASLYTATSPLTRPEYTKFKELCTAANVLAKDFGLITQVDIGKKFTLFVPSNNVIEAAQVAGLLAKTRAVTPNEPNTGGIINDLTKRARLEAYIRYFFVQDKQILTDGKITGTLSSARYDPLSTPTNPVYIPVSVTYPGSILTFNEIGTTTTGKVVMSDQLLYPQNTIAIDGIIQIIDNAFTSKY